MRRCGEIRGVGKELEEELREEVQKGRRRFFYSEPKSLFVQSQVCVEKVYLVTERWSRSISERLKCGLRG
jgi:hypothetical protein